MFEDEAPLSPEEIAALPVVFPEIAKIARLRAKPPQRSHKSKKEKRRKPTTKLFGDFVQRSAKPAVHGAASKSALIRVDADFAAYLRGEAKRNGATIVDLTRAIHHSGLLVNKTVRP